jgi:acetyl-CoA carboxylase biotin carboxyl carrier protein
MPKTAYTTKAAPKPAAKNPAPALDINLNQLNQLTSWLMGTGLEEVEIEQAGTRLRLKKPGLAPNFSVSSASASAPAAPAAVAPAAAPAEDLSNAFKSPMVGTFYRAPSPEAAALVKEGDTVQVGQPLAIIEAMKTMNQITATHAGTVRKILVQNAQAVEFGQPLFIIS